MTLTRQEIEDEDAADLVEMLRLRDEANKYGMAVKLNWEKIRRMQAERWYKKLTS